MALTGVVLFEQAEISYSQGLIVEALEFYRLSIKKILKDEDVTCRLSVDVPNHVPRETLGCVWMNFMGFLRDCQMSFTTGSRLSSLPWVICFDRFSLGRYIPESVQTLEFVQALAVG